MARRLFAFGAVVLALTSASAVCAAGYLFVERPRVHMLGSLRDVSLVRAYVFNPHVRRFAAALHEEAGADVFRTVWDTDVGVMLSRRMFREVDMDGMPKYAYKPGLKKLGFVAGVGGTQWKFETRDTPRMRDALRGIDTTFRVEASYDDRGFRRADQDLATDCDRRVLFLGDSFTDGLWVGNAATFANLYGHLARDRAGVRVCPVNAGVNGYGSFEERFVFEHEFERAGRPELVFVMYFPNDVDWDFDAVVAGTLNDADRLWRASLTELRRMHRFAASHESALVLVAIPPFQQLNTRGPQTHYQDVLQRFSAAEGIMFVNPFEDLVRRDPRALYWDWDPHFTPAGHRAMADVLYERTRSLLR